MPKEEIKNIVQPELTEIMELNLGPQHPSTHGVLRIKLKMDGERIVDAEPVIGYLHTGVEKECETRTYHQVFTLIDRLDYLSGPAEEQGFAGAIERLMDVAVPERAQNIRIILLELSRLSSHLLWLGASALELNMSSIFMNCFVKDGTVKRESECEVSAACSNSTVLLIVFKIKK